MKRLLATLALLLAFGGMARAQLPPTNTTGVDFAANNLLGVSAATHARIRFNTGTGVLEQSLAGAAYTPLGGSSSTTLQQAYTNGGPSGAITITSGTPIALTLNAVGATTATPILQSINTTAATNVVDQYAGAFEASGFIWNVGASTAFRVRLQGTAFTDATNADPAWSFIFRDPVSTNDVLGVSAMYVPTPTARIAFTTPLTLMSLVVASSRVDLDATALFPSGTEDIGKAASPWGNSYLSGNLIPTVTNTNTIGTGTSVEYATGWFGTSLRSPLFDSDVAGTVGFGTVTATAVSLGKTGITTTNLGALTISENFTANGTTNTIGDAATDTLAINAVVNTNLTFIKEVARTISVAATTTANTAGSSLTIFPGAGQGSGAGADLVLLGGTRGGTGGALEGAVVIAAPGASVNAQPILLIKDNVSTTVFSFLKDFASGYWIKGGQATTGYLNSSIDGVLMTTANIGLYISGTNYMNMITSSLSPNVDGGTTSFTLGLSNKRYANGFSLVWTGYNTAVGVATATTGLLVKNDTAAQTGGLVQFSPQIELWGQGFNSADLRSSWFLQSQPCLTGTCTAGNLAFQYKTGVAALVTPIIMNSAGTFGTYNSEVTAGVGVDYIEKVGQDVASTGGGVQTTTIETFTPATTGLYEVQVVCSATTADTVTVVLSYTDAVNTTAQAISILNAVAIGTNGTAQGNDFIRANTSTAILTQITVSAQATTKCGAAVARYN